MHEIYVDFMPKRTAEQPFGSFKYREKLILDYSYIFNQVEKSSTSALHRTPDPSTLPTPPSEPKLVNVTSTSVTLAWNKIQQKQGSTSFIGYTVEYFSSDLQKGWVSALQRIPSNVVTVSWCFCCLFKTMQIVQQKMTVAKPQSSCQDRQNLLLLW